MSRAPRPCEGHALPLQHIEDRLAFSERLAEKNVELGFDKKAFQGRRRMSKLFRSVETLVYEGEEAMKATDAERAPGYLAGHFPEFKRDVRQRVYVCDCMSPRQQYARRDMDKPFAPTRVQANVDGTCPHCGYFAKMVIDDAT